MPRHDPVPPIDVARKSLRQLHDSVESSVDPLGMTAPLVHAQLAWMAHPQELAEALVGCSGTRSAAILAVTGRGRPAVLPEVFHDWLSKPYSARELYTLIARSRPLAAQRA